MKTQSEHLRVLTLIAMFAACLSMMCHVVAAFTALKLIIYPGEQVTYPVRLALIAIEVIVATAAIKKLRANTTNALHGALALFGGIVWLPLYLIITHQLLT